MQCTKHGRGTVPMSVNGMHEDGKLKLMFASNPEEYHTTAPCSGELSPEDGWFPSRKYVEVVFDVFFDQMEPLVVVAEDGEEGRLVEDISEQAKQDGLEPPGMWGRIFSIRLKALPPEEGGSRPVSGGTGHSTPELSGPLLADD